MRESARLFTKKPLNNQMYRANAQVGTEKNGTAAGAWLLVLQTSTRAWPAFHVIPYHKLIWQV